MPKPRKSWEPVYRFGASGDRYFDPPPLGENRNISVSRLPKTKKRKK